MVTRENFSVWPWSVKSGAGRSRPSPAAVAAEAVPPMGWGGLRDRGYRAVSRKLCAAVPLQLYCTSCTPSAVEAAGTSRHLPLLRFTKW